MNKKRLFFALVFGFILTLIFFLTAEGILRISGNYTTNSEKNGNGYISAYGNGYRSEWLYRYYAGTETYHLNTTEFVHHREINAVGFTDHRLPSDFDKSDNTIRILALGDSFTEGMGADYNETWPQVLESRLRAECGAEQWMVYNAGICGCDPFFSFKNLEFLYPLIQPDIVIELLNSSDFHDVYMRGGWERFLPDGTTRYSRQPPWWEGIYQKSHFIRFVLHEVLNYNSLLTKEDNADVHSSTYALLIEATGRSQQYLEKYGAVYVPLFLSKHPPGGFHPDYLPDSAFISMVKNRFPSFLYLDPLIKENGGPQLFWEQDFHLTPEGYDFIAAQIAQHIKELAIAKGIAPCPSASAERPEHAP